MKQSEKKEKKEKKKKTPIPRYGGWMNGRAYKTNTPNTTHEYTLTPEIYEQKKNS